MKKLLAILLLVTTVSTVCAHEYVLLAYNFVTKKGDLLELHLFVSDGFNIQLERPVQKVMTKKFSLITEKGERDLKPLLKDGDLPVLEIKVDFEGLGLFYMERDYAETTSPTARFQSYLKGDNIENVTLDTSKVEQRERYTRYLKTLVQSNPKQGDNIYSKEVGQNFEIILMDNPYTANMDDWIDVKILFMGKPLADKAITARNRNANEASTHQYARTDSMGICSFKLEREGEWFIHATHMIPSKDLEKADWESFWSTYSFAFADNRE